MSKKKDSMSSSADSGNLEERLSKQENDLTTVINTITDLRTLMAEMQVTNARVAAAQIKAEESKFNINTNTNNNNNTTTTTNSSAPSLSLNDLNETNLLLSSMLGKRNTPLVPPRDPNSRHPSLASKFIDLTKGSDDDATSQLGKVAKAWEKDLKAISDSYSKKDKLKKAASYAEFSRFILKRILGLTDVVAIRRYVALLLAVNRLNHGKDWSFALAYALIWLKRDQKAAKLAPVDMEAARKLLPPNNLDAEIIALAEIKKDKMALKLKKENKDKKNKGSSCFVCGKAGHWANACPTPCSNCNRRGHNAQNCFLSAPQLPQASQSHQSNLLGGPVLVPQLPAAPNSIVCGKCGRMGHAASQCGRR